MKENSNDLAGILFIIIFCLVMIGFFAYDHFTETDEEAKDGDVFSNIWRFDRMLGIIFFTVVLIMVIVISVMKGVL